MNKNLLIGSILFIVALISTIGTFVYLQVLFAN